MLLLIASAALAQDPEPDIRYEPVSKVEFGEPLQVEGEVVEPQLDVHYEARRKAFQRLFAVRTHFEREIVESADEIK